MTPLLLVILHAQHEDGILQILVQGREGVLIQKFHRGNSEAVFHTQNVVGRQEDIDVAAAFVETGHARMTGETKGVVLGQARVFFENGFL